MKIKAWIHMGTERRDTVIDIPDEEIRDGRALYGTGWAFFEWIQKYALDWIHCQFGWGWSPGSFENDLSFMENGEGEFCVTNESAVPNTIRSERIQSLVPKP